MIGNYGPRKTNIKEKISEFTATWVPWILIFILTTVLSIMTLTVDKRCSKCDLCEDVIVNMDRFQMYNRSLEKIVSGAYFYSNDYGYYCIWTKGRSLAEVKRTDCHETCHALIQGDFEGWNKTHFCY